ncbi:uncharacterized protein LOC109859151 isoform X2 [Pseudomyrmex gracilis]|uniref:uncharacterized protein LOC109859151 isoform X2 n=1 Tax=Pseudomyrmex gracilis TaxID=219809 RepID=UPI000994B162|nr:uncharacterized protein LOC109859151 isoform X2 [Pseudomyrmex gracilis]
MLLHQLNTYRKLNIKALRQRIYIYNRLLDTNNEVEYSQEAIELQDARVQETTMTCLGTLVFADKHSRQSLSMSDSTKTQVVNSLSLAYEDLFTIPHNILQDFGTAIYHLDISHNMFSRNLQFLSEFDNLRSLNMDHNMIDDTTVFPHMPNLELLWLNHNQIANLYPFVKNLQRSIPNLKYLCLMGNKAAPSYLNGGTFYDYINYRLFVLSWFPYLVHLDDRTVTEEQRLEAKRLYKRPIYEDLIPLPKCIKDLSDKIIVSKPPIPNTQQVARERNSII